MSNRNFILLIIILTIATAGVFIYFYFNPIKTKTVETSPDIDFFSEFNPFKKKKVTPPKKDEPITSEKIPEAKKDILLKKISSMPIAGFTVFQKEVLKKAKESFGSPTYPVSPGSLTSQNLKEDDVEMSDEELNKEIDDLISEASIKKNLEINLKIKSQLNATGSTETEFVPALRYVARADGNIYQTFADEIKEVKFTDTVVPKVYEAYFGNNGESVIMRYLKNEANIETFMGALPKEKFLDKSDFPSTDKSDFPKTSQNMKIIGSFLPENILDVSVKPATSLTPPYTSSEIFYLLKIPGEVLGIISNLFNNKKLEIFDSQFTEWLSQWPNQKIISLTTKPSARVLGYMYIIDPDKKDFNRILGNINGLTTLMSPDGNFVLYSGNNLLLQSYNIETKTSTSLGIKTMPEKCVWAKNNIEIYCSIPNSVGGGEYPDIWYQGEISFTDQIFKINTETGKTNLLVDPISIEGGENIDGIKLALDENENYLFFVNKKDSFLWQLKIK
ncbi:MAG: hypothetical protein AAB693_02140 [Patescibacteria group bacterium]|mgnify:FL=1